jgi:hypothetical protein
MQPMVILGVLNLLLIVVVGCFNWFSHNKIVGNDLTHLTADVKTLISRQESISEKVIALATDLSFLKGKCALNACRKSFKKSKKISNKV